MNLLVRGLNEETVSEIDRAAESLGISRNEFLRRKLVEQFPGSTKRRLTREDFLRAAEASKDLLDDEVMAGAWR